MTFLRVLNGLLATLTMLVFLSVAGFVIIFVSREIDRQTVRLNLVEVPPLLEERGFSSQVITQRLGNEVALIRQKVKVSSKQVPDFSLSAMEANIEVPIAGFTFQALVRFLRYSMGLPETVIDGEITLLPGSLHCPDAPEEDPCLGLELRIAGERSAKLDVKPMTLSSMDALIRLSAEDLVRAFDGYLLALSFYDSDEIDRTLEEIGHMLKPGPDTSIAYDFREDDVWAYNLWGQILRRDDPKGAIEKFRKAVNLEADFTLALNNWGVTLVGMGAYDDAIEKFQAAIESDPEFPDAYLILGIAQHRVGDLDAALASYKTALSLSETPVSVHMNMGFTHYYRHDFANANSSFRRARRAAHGDPDAVAAFGRQVRQYIALWRHLSAQAADEEVTFSLSDAAPGFDLAVWPGPVVSLYLGDGSVAEVLDAALRDPLQTEAEGLCEAHFYIGKHYLLNGDTERAAEHFSNTIGTEDYYCFEYAFAGAELDLIGAD